MPRVSENERDPKDPALDRYHGVDAEQDDRRRVRVSCDLEPERVPPQIIEIGDVSRSARDSRRGCPKRELRPVLRSRATVSDSGWGMFESVFRAIRSFHAMVDDGDSLELLVHSDELNRHEPYVDFARLDCRSHPHHNTKRGSGSGGTFPMGAHVRDPIGEI